MPAGVSASTASRRWFGRSSLAGLKRSPGPWEGRLVSPNPKRFSATPTRSGRSSAGRQAHADRPVRSRSLLPALRHHQLLYIEVSIVRILATLPRIKRGGADLSRPSPPRATCHPPQPSNPPTRTTRRGPRSQAPLVARSLYEVEAARAYNLPAPQEDSLTRPANSANSGQQLMLMLLIFAAETV